MKCKTLTFLFCLSLASCGGLRTFHDYARAGDTVAVPVGMQPDFNKDNITVTITPSYGLPITFNSTDPSIRAIINLYPDPISNMTISREIGEDTTPNAQAYADTTLFSANYDKDYYQTTVFIDLPSTLPEGLTQISVNNNSGTSHTATLNIVPGTGAQNNFSADINGELFLNDNMLDSLSRSSHTEITFDSVELPHAIEINFTHDADVTAGGTGKAFVINPLGYRKNLHWQDDGINLKVILIESNIGLVDDIKDFKFYIAGTTSNLQLQSVNSFDINGNSITGTTALLTTR